MKYQRRLPVGVDPALLRPDAVPGELRRHALAPLLDLAWRMTGAGHRNRPANFLLGLAKRLEGGGQRSSTARRWLSHDYHVHVGAYSYGPCLRAGAFPPTVSVGRYVSVGPGVRVYTQNHPLDRLSTHSMFYDGREGLVDGEQLEPGVLRIEHDAWIGAGAVVLPGCRRIGIGSVVGAGSVVTKDVPDFAIAAGVPAKPVRLRFDDPTRKLVLESKWWEKPANELREHLAAMTLPLGESPEDHPLLRSAANAADAGHAGAGRTEEDEVLTGVTP